MSKMMISLGVFFHLFKILIFQIVRGGGGGGLKGQKIAQNEIYKLHISHIISQK